MDAKIEILLFDYEAAAKALSLTRASLRDLVYKNRGPRVTKIGRRTFFARKDLEDFIDMHRQHPRRPAQNAIKRKRGRPTIREQIEAEA